MVHRFWAQVRLSMRWERLVERWQQQGGVPGGHIEHTYHMQPHGSSAPCRRTKRAQSSTVHKSGYQRWNPVLCTMIKI